MQYKGTLIAVSDMEKSKEFYCDLLGMKVVEDFGANVQLDSGMSVEQVAIRMDVPVDYVVSCLKSR